MRGDLKFNFEEIGTRWVIEIQSDKYTKPDLILKKIKKEISDFSLIFSRFIKDSEISLAGKSIRSIRIPQRYLSLLDTYQKLYQLTGGIFTPLIGNLLVDAGYDENYSLKPGRLNPVPDWDTILEYCAPILKLKQSWILDFGAGGKGFLVDLVSGILNDENVNSYCIDAGGDIFYKSSSNKKLKVGLENPENFNQVLGVAEILNESICGSSGNRRKWGKYHHIFNPKTLDSVREILAVWVVADNALIADSISTCLFFVDPDKLKTSFKFEYLVVYPDNTFKKSEDFNGEIFYN